MADHQPTVAKENLQKMTEGEMKAIGEERWDKKQRAL